MFHNHFEDAETKEIQARIQLQLDDLKKTEDDILRDWISQGIYKDLITEGTESLETLRQLYDDRDNELDLEVVVTVPPGRSIISHEKVLQAFKQGPIKAGQVSLVSEPEAMFRSWIHDGIDSQDWKVKTSYLVPHYFGYGEDRCLQHTAGQSVSCRRWRWRNLRGISILFSKA